jgi:hypothetical protein
MFICKICEIEFKRFNSNHVKFKHNLSTDEYIKLYPENFFQPCLFCGKQIHKSKRFCSRACVTRWNVMQQLKNGTHVSIKYDFSGKNNPMYGKFHTEETKKIISIKCGRPSKYKGLTLEEKYGER